MTAIAAHSDVSTRLVSITPALDDHTVNTLLMVLEARLQLLSRNRASRYDPTADTTYLDGGEDELKTIIDRLRDYSENGILLL